jgi:hypothetical protein
MTTDTWSSSSSTMLAHLKDFYRNPGAPRAFLTPQEALGPLSGFAPARHRAVGRRHRRCPQQAEGAYPAAQETMRFKARHFRCLRSGRLMHAAPSGESSASGVASSEERARDGAGHLST